MVYYRVLLTLHQLHSPGLPTKLKINLIIYLGDVGIFFAGKQTKVNKAVNRSEAKLTSL